MNTEIVILTKAPIPGRVKTRLIPELGEKTAAALHWEMVWATLALASKTPFPVRISLDGDEDGQFTKQLVAAGYTIEKQVGGDLGKRMAHVLNRPGRQIVLGTDCVVFEPAWIELAANTAAPVAIGPSDDGGYWSISVNGNCEDLMRRLFEGIRWSTETVFRTTISRLEQENTPYTLLPKTYDVDVLPDVNRLRTDPRCCPNLRKYLASIFQTSR